MHAKGKIEIRLLLLLVVIFVVPALAVETAAVEQIQTQVELDSLIYFVQALSGEVPVQLNGESIRITTRNYAFGGNEYAFEWLKANLIRWGYTVEEQPFADTGRNLFATKPGTATPEQIYILCAHYDSWPYFDPAPGADDNASGVAAVLEAARILSEYQSDATLLFGFWDEEELGYVGSHYYVDTFWSGNEKPAGVINLDMLAYDANGDNLAIINTHVDIAQSDQLRQEMENLNSSLGIGLSIQVYEPRIASDQNSFWDGLISTIGLHEDVLNEINAYYHSVNDQIEHFNLPYYHKMAELAILTFASVSGVQIPDTSVDSYDRLDFALLQNYPNPFNATTAITFRLSDPAQVRIRIYDLNGRFVHELTNAFFPAGNQTVFWHAGNLPTGLYLYRFESGAHVETRKMLLQK